MGTRLRPRHRLALPRGATEEQDLNNPIPTVRAPANPGPNSATTVLCGANPAVALRREKTGGEGDPPYARDVEAARVRQGQRRVSPTFIDRTLGR